MVRVVQGKEPLHFLRMFNRRITILQGGIDSGFTSFGQENGEQQNGHGKSHLEGTLLCVPQFIRYIGLFFAVSFN